MKELNEFNGLNESGSFQIFQLFQLFQHFFVNLYNYLTISNFLSVESSFHPINNTDTPLKIDIGLIKEVLKTGHSVELPATGYSMFPTLRPGDRVVVKPLAKGELPLTGSVVVCVDNGATAQRRNGATVQRHNDITPERHNSTLVMHRLVEFKNDDSGNSLLITRGDSARETDKPWRQEQLLGSAISYKRRRKEHLIKAFAPGVWRYLFNHRMLWVYIKMRESGKRPEV